jgi:HK97 family phage portal protein
MKNKKANSILKKFSNYINANSERKNNKILDQIASNIGYKTYFNDVGKPVWMNRNYTKFADEGYIKNVISYRAVSMISKAVSTIPIKLFEKSENGKTEIKKSEILNLLNFPNPLTNGRLFVESVVSYRIISGNSYILSVKSSSGKPIELYSLRPDRVSIISDKEGYTTAYVYNAGNKDVKYHCDKITGKSAILHLKNFHPLDDHYGLSAIEAAAYSIDQHNQSANWNQALLQNGAKPSGALIIKPQTDGGYGNLTDEQYLRIKKQLSEDFMGYNNAGKPIILEGGMDWKELSLSPKDMDYIESKNISAREIALAFGVPPQLLGITGDNTYSNLAEARLAFWEQTIIPMVDEFISALNSWLVPMFGNAENLSLAYDLNNIDALSLKREKLWSMVSNADFLTIEEKRRMVGV